MINLFKNINFLFISRLLLGFIFIYASIDKILDPLSFSNLIDNYHVTPVFLNNLFALFVPMLELVIGICLIFNLNINGASFISIALLLWFLFILSQALVRGINVDCGCFDLNSGTASVICYLFTKESNIKSGLDVSIKSKKYNEFLRNR